MRTLNRYEQNAIQVGTGLNLEPIQYIGESLLLASFFGFLVAPITTPNAIVFCGLVGGFLATSSVASTLIT